MSIPFYISFYSLFVLTVQSQTPNSKDTKSISSDQNIKKENVLFVVDGQQLSQRAIVDLENKEQQLKKIEQIFQQFATDYWTIGVMDQPKIITDLNTPLVVDLKIPLQIKMSSEALTTLNEQIRTIEIPETVSKQQIRTIKIPDLDVDTNTSRKNNAKLLLSFDDLYPFQEIKLYKESAFHIEKIWRGECFEPPHPLFNEDILCRDFSLCQKFTIHLKSATTTDIQKEIYVAHHNSASNRYGRGFYVPIFRGIGLPRDPLFLYGEPLPVTENFCFPNDLYSDCEVETLDPVVGCSDCSLYAYPITVEFNDISIDFVSSMTDIQIEHVGNCTD